MAILTFERILWGVCALFLLPQSAKQLLASGSNQRFTPINTHGMNSHFGAAAVGFALAAGVPFEANHQLRAGVPFEAGHQLRVDNSETSDFSATSRINGVINRAGRSIIERSVKITDYSNIFKHMESLIDGMAFAPARASAAALDDSKSLRRLDAALSELQQLDKGWEQIVHGEGDNVRRRLGTVYSPPSCDSPLCSMDLFLSRFQRAHGEAGDLDLEAFEEPAAAFLQALNQADFLAYSSIFSEYGNGGGGANYIALSHEQVCHAAEALYRVIEVVRASD